jgi:hypothetical protein
LYSYCQPGGCAAWRAFGQKPHLSMICTLTPFTRRKAQARIPSELRFFLEEAEQAKT